MIAVEQHLVEGNIAMQVAMLSLELAMMICRQFYKHEDWLPVLRPWVTSGPTKVSLLPALPSASVECNTKVQGAAPLWGWAKFQGDL